MTVRVGHWVTDRDEDGEDTSDNDDHNLGGGVLDLRSHQ